MLIITLAMLLIACFMHGAHAQQGVFSGGQKFVVISTVSTNSQMIGLPGPHQLLEVSGYNTGPTLFMDLKLYDTSAPPVCSSATTLVGIYPIGPAGRIEVTLGPLGATFKNGIGICIVANAAPATLIESGNSDANEVLNFTIK